MVSQGGKYVLFSPDISYKKMKPVRDIQMTEKGGTVEKEHCCKIIKQTDLLT